MRLVLAELTADERAAQSSRICLQLTAPPAWQQAETLMAFVPMVTEPDVLPCLRHSAAQGRVIALPRWNPVASDYQPALMPGDGQLVPGPFGVLEPPPDSPTFALEQLDLVVVPGLAFDRCGRRLGRGKGFFDRLLTRARRAQRWGVAFGLQIVDEVPTAPHDVNVDVLVTPEFRLPLTARGAM
jgi:5-formyltetrahydrofolate cyclo-ligase